MPIHAHLAAGGIDDPANDADQRRLARTVWPEQGEDFAAVDGQVHAFEGGEPGLIGFGQPADADDGFHRLSLTTSRGPRDRRSQSVLILLCNIPIEPDGLGLEATANTTVSSSTASESAVAE